MDAIVSWLKTELESVWRWLGVEEAKAAALLSPVIDELAALLKKDVGLDLGIAASAVATAFSGGTAGEALLAVAYDAVKSAAVTQGIQLSEEAAVALSASLSAGAQAPVPQTASLPASPPAAGASS